MKIGGQIPWNGVPICETSVWETSGGRNLWNVTVFCETSKISCLMGNLHMKGGSECHLTDVEYHTFSSKDQSSLHQCGAKVLPSYMR